MKKITLITMISILLFSCKNDDDQIITIPTPDTTVPEIEAPETVSVSPVEFRKDYPRKGVLKVEYHHSGKYLVLLEDLPELYISPGYRTVEILDINGQTKSHISISGDEKIIDAILDNNFVFISSILYSSEKTESILIKKFDHSGNLIDETQVYTDEENDLPLIYVDGDDRSRIKIGKENIYMAIFDNNQKAYLAVFSKENLNEKWPPIEIETGPKKTLLGIFGDPSYDSFQQLSGRYKIYLDIDADENIYIGLPISKGFYVNNTLISKISPEGNILYTISTGDEMDFETTMQDFKVFDNQIVITGRRLANEDSDSNDWNPYIVMHDTETGNEVFSQNYTLAGNEIFFSLGYDIVSKKIYAGGSAGWSQNPNGASVTANGNKILVKVDNSMGAIENELTLTNGPRQNQIRSVQVVDDFLIIAGWENGPGTHSGDSDKSLIFADGFMEVFKKE